MAVQAHTELRNLYVAGNETLVHALMRQSVSLLRQQQVPSAVQASRQAFDMVQQVRCLPLLHAQAAALHGRCCAVQTLLASQPAAKGEQPYAIVLTPYKQKPSKPIEMFSLRTRPQGNY